MGAFGYYIIFWTSACLLAAALVILNPGSYGFLKKNYLRFLLVRWKAVTFLIAAAGGCAIAPYTGDYTWDYYDMAAMSVLTYLTAPWSVGALVRAWRRMLSPVQAYVAICMTMFSSSWFYDAYLLLRDGFYPHTWLLNIPASLVLYISAGLLWNLDRTEEKGVVFTFDRGEWFDESVETGFRRVAPYALPFILLVVLIYGFFVFNNLYLHIY